MDHFYGKFSKFFQIFLSDPKSEPRSGSAKSSGSTTQRCGLPALLPIPKPTGALSQNLIVCHYFANSITTSLKRPLSRRTETIEFKTGGNGFLCRSAEELKDRKPKVTCKNDFKNAAI